jgi:phosphoribosylformylglycinamidine synthase subunit PurS
MKARIIVRLKQTVHDPQGEAIHQSFEHMGYQNFIHVRQGKVFDVELQDMEEAKASALLHEVAHKVLANPVIEEYVIELGDKP